MKVMEGISIEQENIVVCVERRCRPISGNRIMQPGSKPNCTRDTRRSNNLSRTSYSSSSTATAKNRPVSLPAI